MLLSRLPLAALPYSKATLTLLLPNSISPVLVVPSPLHRFAFHSFCSHRRRSIAVLFVYCCRPVAALSIAIALSPKKPFPIFWYSHMYYFNQ